jgi:hypothetical protein
MPDRKLLDSLKAPIRWCQRRSALLADKQQHFEHEVAIGAIFKNEADYLDEWIEFHFQFGVTHFFLYNNNSTDDWQRVIEPWTRRGVVSVTDWPELGAQQKAYNHCLRKVRRKCRWIAFIDIDEFLFSPTGATLPEVLRDYQGQTAIFVYWILFGSAGHRIAPHPSVIASYLRCLDRESAIHDRFDHRVGAAIEYVSAWAQDGKSIVNPRLVENYRIHLPGDLWQGEVLDETGLPPIRRATNSPIPCSVLRINHYWSKSLSELEAKVNRGMVNRKPSVASTSNAQAPDLKLATWLERERDLNVTEDRTILQFWDADAKRRIA